MAEEAAAMTLVEAWSVQRTEQSIGCQSVMEISN